MDKGRFVYNEQLRFFIDLMKNLAVASITAGVLVPIFTGKIEFVISVPFGMMLALCFSTLAHLMIRDLWLPEELKS